MDCPLGKLRVSLLLSSLALALALLGLTLTIAGARSDREPPIPLRLAAGQFDPVRDASPAPASLNGAPLLSPYLLVQFRGPIRPEWREALEAAGARILDYLPDYAYVIRAPPGLADLLAALPGVRWVGEYRPAYRVDPALWAASGPQTVTVQFFEGEDPAPLAHLPGVDVLAVARTRWQTTVRARLDGSLIPTIARLPGVRWVEPAPHPRLTNDVAAHITGAAAVRATLGLTGSGQIVAVADTGLDVGASGPITDFAGRILSTHCLGRPSPCQWDDPHGHGTHVAGSIAGSGVLSGGQFAGMAPGAALVVQSLYSPTQPGDLYVPSDLTLLFSPAYTDGARIHNDSWGSAGNRYDTWAQTADQFVWDHPDMLVVVAAGNGGTDRGADGLTDPGSLYSPATAKNVLAVGASESFRIGEGDTKAYGNHPGAYFPADPVRGDAISDDPGGLAAFSSRGPAADGRVKPDMVAPGTNIVSARSHHPDATYPYTRSDHYAYYSGSSQATALASGAAALVRQWLTEHGFPAPSAALMKAALINGAADLTPGQYGPAVTGTVVVSDDVEGSGVWTSTTWVVTSTWGSHSPDRAWVAVGQIGIQRLDATLDLSGVSSPTLILWNYRSLSYSAARVYACGIKKVEYGSPDSARLGWAVEAIDIRDCAGNAAALIRFEFQCTTYKACTADVWAVDDIVVADGARLAEVGPAPDPGQGWGRLSLTGTLGLTPSARWYGFDEAPGLETGWAVGYQAEVTGTAASLRATLAWSDYPASPAAAKALVNDLDLLLETPEGEVVYPNGADGPDRINNVERIELRSPPPGTYRLVVRGVNVPLGPQPYGLVVSVEGYVRPLRAYLPLVARAMP